MGSIDKYIFRTTLASLALIPGSLAGVLWIARALGGVDPMTGQGGLIPTPPGFDRRMIPASAIGESPAVAAGESNARLLLRPATA